MVRLYYSTYWCYIHQTCTKCSSWRDLLMPHGNLCPWPTFHASVTKPQNGNSGAPVMVPITIMSRFKLLLQNFNLYHTVDASIFMGTNFCGLIKNHTFMGFKVRGHSIFLHNSYWKSLFSGYLNSWIGPSTKTTKIGTPRKLSYLQ